MQRAADNRLTGDAPFSVGELTPSLLDARKMANSAPRAPDVFPIEQTSCACARARKNRDVDDIYIYT